MITWLMAQDLGQTFRSAAAALTAFGLSLLAGRRVIDWLRRTGLRENTAKTDSARLAELRASKQSTPTMGGVLVVSVVCVSTLLWAKLDGYAGGALALLLALAAIGMRDDWIKLTHSDRHGLSASRKFLLIGLVALATAIALHGYAWNGGQRELMQLPLPFSRNTMIDLAVGLGIGYALFATLVIISAANAVNLTDGMDGLAIGCVTIVAITLGLYSYIAGRADYTFYLGLPHIQGAGELAVFCCALTGAGLGFLWFNCYPADVFMGDTGSLPLGGVLGYVAVVTRQELMLLLIGGVFVAEALSVILQVGSFKLRRVRIFRCAPLHHHFEFGGLAETKVTVRFWIIAAMLALMGLASLKLR
jgi:phospho-N-acetylmuramoyl-pentapeptide-transferase